jgi:predicted enzyme related to lactoylglutathione lyase
MLNFNSLLIFSEKPESLAAFYKHVFQTDPIWEAEGYTTFAVGNGAITIGPHSEVHGRNQDSARIMFNLETEEVEKEFERIKNLGVHIIKEPYGPEETGGEGLIATFADPDGNYFQLMSPMPENM